MLKGDASRGTATEGRGCAMSLVKKILTLITSLLMIIVAVGLVIEPEIGYYIMISILIGVLLVKSIQSVWYYFSMARHMVGGLFYFYQAVLFVDLTLAAPILLIAPRWIVALYLNGLIAFSGVLDILRATDQKKMQWPQWKLRMVLGLSKVLFAIVAMVAMRSPEMLTRIYSFVLVYTAIMRVMSALRSENVVYYTQ